MRVVALATALLLGGCTFSLPVNLPGVQASQNADVSVPLSFGGAPAPTQKVTHCPAMVAYTPAQIAALSRYLDDSASDQTIVGFLADYHDMRVADDVCLHPTK